MESSPVRLRSSTVATDTTVERARGAMLLVRAARLSSIGLFISSALVLIYLGRYVLMPVAAGVLLGLTLGPSAVRLERHGIPSFLSGAVIITTLFGAMTLLVIALAVPLETWSSRIPEVTERLAQEWRHVREPIEKIREVEKQVEAATDSAEKRPMPVTVAPKGIMSNMISSAPEVLAKILLFTGTFYFFLATRSQLRSQGLRLCQTIGARLSLARIIRDVETALSRYVLTVTAVNACMGTVVGIAMYALGVPSPFLWGVLAAVFNYAPFIGPAIMAGILVGVGLVSFDGMWQSLTPALAFLGINFIEGQYVTPTVLGRTLTLNALLVFLAIAFWLWLWGPVGAFLAVPFLVVGSVALSHVIRSGRER
ncbi:MAG: AI-2E family transporter [Alphaproteobacteria bacterium]